MDSDQQLPLVESNEIILDLQCASSPTIQWKIKNGSTVRLGEILAQYSLSSPRADNPSSTSTATKNMGDSSSGGTGSNNALSTTTPSSGSGGRKKIIRPKKRNRNIIPKLGTMDSTSSSNNTMKTLTSHVVTGSNKANDEMVGMDDLLNSFRTSSRNNSKRKQNNSDIISSNSTGSSSSGNTGGRKRGNETTASTTTSSNATDKTITDKWVPIVSTMNGFVDIYKSMKRKLLKEPMITIDSDDELDEEKKSKERMNRIVFVLGKIEACQHPAVIDGLCAVCGQSVVNAKKKTNINIPQSMLALKPLGNNSSNSNSNANAKRDAYTLSGGMTVSISQDYAQSLSKTTYQSLRSSKKLHLVLDLDHTLLHATADRRASKWLSTEPDLKIVLLPMMEGHPLYELQQQQTQNPVGGGMANVWQPHYVKLRPHLAEFISKVMEKYEITIYTAGTRTYANKIADVISRHIYDHQQQTQREYGTNNTKDEIIIQHDDDEKCLDEGELNDLKQKVARLEERSRWDKSRKERQEYVKKMNEQFNSLKKNEENVEEEGEEEIVKAGNGVKFTNTTDKEIHVKECESTDMPKKRRKVCFSESVIEKDDATKSTYNKPIKTKSVEENNSQESNNEDPLDQLKIKLKAAEAREVAAQALRKKIFGSRIISRTDLPDLGRAVKSLERVCPCGKMAAIVDDREDVWANADNNATGRKGEPPQNLLLVKPYHFSPFHSFADVNNVSGNDYSEDSAGQGHDDEIDESDVQLLWTRNTLMTVYAKFYGSKESEHIELTVPSILTRMRRAVLSSNNSPSKILLSGLVPLHKQNRDSSDETIPRHEVVRYVEELGGIVMNTVSKDVTHVIASKDGTNKILQARRIPGCAISRITWLMECYWSITKIDIVPHYLGNPPMPKPNVPGNAAKKILLTDSDSDEDDDDDFEELRLAFKAQDDNLS